MKTLLLRINALLSSCIFFWVVIVFFILESAWIAISAIYPQAFDENFHFGLIQIYAHHWLPFLTSQPPHTNAFGAVARDPSYLYHYLMSFPYRFIAHITHSQTIQIIFLRFINIALFATSLIIFRRVMRRVGTSSALTNVSMALFVLIPIVPQLAGQINYDNLLFPLVAWTCLLTLKIIDDLRSGKLSARATLILIMVCIYASLVQYEFLPIDVGIGLFLIYEAYRRFHFDWRSLLADLWKSWQQQKHWVQVLLVVLFIIAVGLFAQRDGFNLIEYHTIAPNCSKVLTVKDCKAYAPWSVAYDWHQKVINKTSDKTFQDPILYLAAWMYWMWYRLFFAVNGPASGFKNYPPLPLPAAAALAIVVPGIAALWISRRRIVRANPHLAFIILLAVIYILALWVDGYKRFLYTDALVLMNGRYLLPILLFIAAIFGRAISVLLRRWPHLKTVLAVVAILFFLQGGGVFTFILRSDASWDWHNQTVVKVNNVARNILDKVTLTDEKKYDSIVWFFN